MKKIFAVLLSAIIVVSCAFAACSKDADKNSQSSTEGLENQNNEFGFETQEVTDKNGETVTDEDGNPVTTQVAVVYKKDKNGKTYAYLLDSDGNETGVTIPIDDDNSSSSNKNSNANDTEDKKTNTTTAPAKTTGTTKHNVPMTGSQNTTEFNGNETVPKTSATGKEVNFSVADQNTLKSMLEVPYLYIDNYENSDGVPISIATHVAVWMAERDGSSRNVYPASPVVLNLFKYFGQTVVNFKTLCNKNANSAKAPISYDKSNDTFVISEYTPKVQTVSITKIEDLGNNNFYKVTASVKGCSKKKVVAVVQKNRLDTTLGFSIKALKWS